MRQLGCGAESLARTEKEILAEKAAALARIAGTLDALLEELGRLRQALHHLSGGGRARIIEAHNSLRERACLYRWYLEVQREALGLLRHEGLDDLYPVPGPITPGRSPACGP